MALVPAVRKGQRGTAVGQAPKSRGRLGKVRYVIVRYRRLSQLTVLGFLILAPFLNWFRFDLQTASFYLFGMRFFARHFFYIGLLAVAVIYLIIAASVIFGRLFCGWACPQNLFNELGRRWDQRLGRPGAIALSGAVGLFGGFVLVSYFLPPAQVWRGLLVQPISWGLWLLVLAIGAFFTFAMAWWRTGICRMACPYGHLQSILSTPNTMHLALFQTGTDICATCGLCAETCHMGVDPRTPEQKHCVTCGDCLDACQLVSGARKVPRVLSFVVGPEKQPVGFSGRLLGNLKAMVPRLAFPIAAGIILTLVSAVGIAARPQVHVNVWKDYQQGAGGNAVAILVMNLSDAPEIYRIAQSGLPRGWALLEAEELALDPGQQGQVMLRITPHFAPDTPPDQFYPYTVRVVGTRTGVTETVEYTYYPGR